MDHSDMSMTSTASSMVMSMASTATSAAATATSTAKMSMGGMGGMGGGGNSCKISMLWNWYTVDSCFIARSWHVRSPGMFAGSCVGVILLVVSLEFLRRAQRELDRYFRRINNNNSASNHSSHGVVANAQEEAGSSGASTGSAKALNAAAAAGLEGRGVGGGVVAPLRWWQQLVRSALFMVQFAVGYFVMLLAMYYNGYIIICIFIGAFLGAAIFQWDTYYSGAEGPEMRDSCCN